MPAQETISPHVSGAAPHSSAAAPQVSGTAPHGPGTAPQVLGTALHPATTDGDAAVPAGSTAPAADGATLAAGRTAPAADGATLATNDAALPAGDAAPAAGPASAEQFVRTRMLIGEDGCKALSRTRVAVFGLGGVGGSCAEALARAGVGALDIIDNGIVEPSNINRQVIATHSTVGMPKTQAMRERILDINPNCRLVLHDCFFLPDTADAFDFSHYDYVADCVDTVTAKLLLIERAYQAGVPIISCMGAGNKLDPTAFRVADIYDTSICPLAKTIRKECRKRGIEHLKVVYSTEPALEPQLASDVPAPPPGRNSLPGSVSFVPPVAGMIMAGEIVRDLMAR